MRNLNSSELEALAINLKKISHNLEDVLMVIQSEDYVRIGEDGDVWNGEAATMARQTFDELLIRFPDFIEIINNYADYLNNNLAQR